MDVAVDLIEIDLVDAKARQGVLEAADDTDGEPSPREKRDREPVRVECNQDELGGC